MPIQIAPGSQAHMHPQPTSHPLTPDTDKLSGKVAIITGGDSGIGRAVALLFAKHGCDIALMYLEEDHDADHTRAEIEKLGQKCLLFPGDIGEEKHCTETVKKVVDQLGRIDILVNNAGEQHPQSSLDKISAVQLERTFRTNIFSMFYLTKAVLPFLKSGSTIINTTSVTAYKGHPQLIDYSSTKGAIVTFTRSLALSLAAQNIRVNAVAPGPIWTPLIVSTFPEEKADNLGKDTPLGRAGQPAEVATSYLFLASDDSSYMTGQVLHPNGGSIING